MEVFNHVSTLEGYEAAAEDLNARLYDVNEVLFIQNLRQVTSIHSLQQLYHKYARPLKMHEIILLILHTSNLGVQGRPLVESSWNEIIKNTIEDANAANRSVFDALKDKVRDIGLRYYPDENVFPLSMPVFISDIGPD